MKNQQHSIERRWGRGMMYLMWIAVLILLTTIFGRLYEGQHYSGSDVVEENGQTTLVLSRTRDGHYRSDGEINGQPVTFLLDTGASDVNLPANVAERLGLKRGAPLRARTANGTITIYATVLDSISLGPLEMRNVRASINPHMQGEDILLGMSFLKRLDFEQQGGRLSLRYAR